MKNSLTGIEWKRLLVEGIAILVSILLAFSIDAYWDELKERKEEQEFISALYIDFNLNLEKLIYIKDQHEIIENLLIEFESLSSDEILSLSDESVDMYMKIFFSPYSFDPVTGTVDAIIGAGKLNVIQDQNIRNLLTSFLSIIDDSKEEAAFLRSAAQKAMDQMIQQGGPWRPVKPANNMSRTYLPVMTREVLVALRNDSVLFGLVKFQRNAANAYSNELEEAILVTRSILDHLKNTQ